MRYRPEIDGLRAVAVLPVVLFHAGFYQFSGGFIGVDVFFVISGFLITKIILNELKEGKFSISSFYERRARRILPALILVSLFCMPFSWALMLPSQFKDFSQSLMSLALFGSNILFWREAGYFDAAADLKPLLHTWSLAVEEQFYVIFPIMLLTLWRVGRNFALSFVIALSVGSLLLSHWGSLAYPSATFYLLPTRAWELGTGSVCAFILSGRVSYANNALSAVGLILIIVPMFVFDATTPFPSFWALFPVGGTALVILFAGRSTLAAWLLSSRPLVWIGLISYSAYLWHQPLFAFARLATVSEPAFSTMLVLSLLSFGLAAVSWRYIETPFRRRGNLLPKDRANVFVLSFCGMALLLSAGLFGQITNGAPFRATASGPTWAELDLDGRLAPNPGLGMQCIEGKKFKDVVRNPNCRTGEAPRILLWGDSYAMHLSGALAESEISSDYPFIQLARSQCSPILGLGKNGSVITAKECIEFNDQVFALLQEAEDIDIVVMSSLYDLSEVALYDRAGSRRGEGSESFASKQLAATADAILSLGKIPVFVTPTPGNGSDLGGCLAAASGRGLPLDSCNFREAEMTQGRLESFRLLDRLDGRYPVIDLRDVLCSETECVASADGVFLYRDSGHLSLEGSRYIGRSMDPFKSMITVISGRP